MKLRTVGVAVFVHVACMAHVALAKTTVWTVKPEQSPVNFVAVGKPGFLKINGEGAQLEGSADWVDGKLSGRFKVNLASLKTGIDMRDTHMKERYLEVAKFPSADLIVDGVPLKENEQSYNGAFTGKITIKGVSKPVEGTLKLAGLQTSDAKGNAEFTVNVDDFPIGTPSHFGVTVAKTVTVTVAFVAAAQPAVTTAVNK